MQVTDPGGSRDICSQCGRWKSIGHEPCCSALEQSGFAAYFDQFIDQQLAKPDEPETDQPIVHADVGYGAE
jgi:hypothetical protein